MYITCKVCHISHVSVLVTTSTMTWSHMQLMCIQVYYGCLYSPCVCMKCWCNQVAWSPRQSYSAGRVPRGQRLHQVNLTPCVLVLGVDFCTTLQHTVSAFYCMSPKTDRVQCCTPYTVEPFSVIDEHFLSCLKLLYPGRLHKCRTCGAILKYLSNLQPYWSIYYSQLPQSHKRMPTPYFWPNFLYRV